jgi:hypothetical protein
MLRSTRRRLVPWPVSLPTLPLKYSLIVVMTLAAVVYCDTREGLARKAQNKPAAVEKVPVVAADGLPVGVVEMRDGILAAVRTGNIEDLKVALQWNELPPVIADKPVEDPIAYWKSVSGDGQGREILAMIESLFAAGYAVLPVGRDIENNKLYVWPRFAEMDLATLKPEDEVQLYRLVKPADVKLMIAKKRWLGYRLAIGADGTWHSFQKAE